MHPYICSKRPSRGSEIGSEAFLAQTEPVAAFIEVVGTADEVEEAGPERCARGFPLHGIDHGDEPACAGGPDVFISSPRCRPITSAGAIKRLNWVHVADSRHVV